MSRPGDTQEDRNRERDSGVRSHLSGVQLSPCLPSARQSFVQSCSSQFVRQSNPQCTHTLRQYCVSSFSVRSHLAGLRRGATPQLARRDELAQTLSF